MLITYNERYDTMRIAEHDKDGKCVVHIWFTYSTMWTTLPERSIAGVRMLSNVCDDIILHDDGEE